MKRLVANLGQWVDSSVRSEPSDPDHVDWLRVIPFLALHLGCLGVIWTGWSPFAVMVALILYVVRMFAITGFYHRYFSHRSFRTSRAVQFLFALLGASAVQRGPIWWAAHHREHHAFADAPGDPHSPSRDGFWRSHMLWFMTHGGFEAPSKRVRDWMKFPELRWLDRFDIVVPLLLAAGLYGLGEYLSRAHTGLGVTGAQLLVWGFCISTVALFHGTVAINSLGHLWGSRAYDTRDGSRNNALLAVITLGEGWHNNHHHYPSSTRQGHRWWQFDPTYYTVWLMSRLGLVWDIKPVPVELLQPRGSR